VAKSPVLIYTPSGLTRSFAWPDHRCPESQFCRTKVCSHQHTHTRIAHPSVGWRHHSVTPANPRCCAKPRAIRIHARGVRPTRLIARRCLRHRRFRSTFFQRTDHPRPTSTPLATLVRRLRKWTPALRTDGGSRDPRKREASDEGLRVPAAAAAAAAAASAAAAAWRTLRAHARCLLLRC
jgi:hypothetical protein